MQDELFCFCKTLPADDDGEGKQHAVYHAVDGVGEADQFVVFLKGGCGQMRRTRRTASQGTTALKATMAVTLTLSGNCTTLCARVFIIAVTPVQSCSFPATCFIFNGLTQLHYFRIIDRFQFFLNGQRAGSFCLEVINVSEEIVPCCTELCRPTTEAAAKSKQFYAWINNCLLAVLKVGMNC